MRQRLVGAKLDGRASAAVRWGRSTPPWATPAASSKCFVLMWLSSQASQGGHATRVKSDQKKKKTSRTGSNQISGEEPLFRAQPNILRQG